MQNITLWCTALCLAATTHLYAQTTDKETRREIEIERKDKGKREKMTIVIEDDKVTINGKPAEEYEGKERIIIGDDIILDGNRVIVNGRMRGSAATPARRAMLGVYTSDSEGQPGAKVDGVSQGSAAEKAGLKEKDIITKVGDTKIENSADLTKAIGKHKPDEEVEITYLRGGKKNTTKATLGKSPDTVAWEQGRIQGLRGYSVPRMPRLPEFPRFEVDGGNLSIITVPRIRYGMNVQDDEEGRGVMVTDVELGANAAKAGLENGDVITEIDDTPIKDVDALKAALEAKKDQISVRMKVLRKGENMLIDVKVPRKLKSATL
jgi:serine protease Do